MTLHYSLVPVLLACGLFTATAAQAQTGTLTLFANGEELATNGFRAPALTRDGWELQFDHIFVTLADVAAVQTDPPFQADAGGKPAVTMTAAFAMADQMTIDLTRTDQDGRVEIGTITAPTGHYNGLIWSVVPAQTGDWAGQSMVLVGTATRDGVTVDFTLTSADTAHYTCGEYIGDTRKGFVTTAAPADLELTFHLDHVFGRKDKGATNHMNTNAVGFDPFGDGGTQAISLAGLHIGHVGEGHCAVITR